MCGSALLDGRDDAQNVYQKKEMMCRNGGCWPVAMSFQSFFFWSEMSFQSTSDFRMQTIKHKNSSRRLGCPMETNQAQV